MTSEAKVKSIYPAAVLAKLADVKGAGAWYWVYSTAAMGKTEMLATSRRASWAWADAYRKIEGERNKG